MYKYWFALITIFSTLLAYEGTVFWDQNGNGQKDPMEQYAQNIRLSNGLAVTQTNANGAFSLPNTANARFITLYLPANGQCEQWYQPIENKKQTYDFALTPTVQKDTVRFIHISDTETADYKAWVNNLKSYARNYKPDFLIHTGDICYKRGMQWHADHLTEKNLDIPVYYCNGNHDLVAGDYGEQFYEDRFGPTYYAFEKGHALYVVTPMRYGDHAPSYSQKSIGEWLKNLLDQYPKQQPKLFFNHDLFTTKDRFTYSITEKDSICLNDYNLKAWFYGHWHINRVQQHSNTIKSYGTAVAAKGGIDHSPSSFRVVIVDQKGYTTSQLRWTYIDELLEIITPTGSQVIMEQDSLQISVNAYHSGVKIRRIQYHIARDGATADWHSLADYPAFKDLKQLSNFNWQGRSMKRQPGEYKLKIKAILDNNHVISKTIAFTINNPTKKDTIPKLQWTQNIGTNIFMTSPLVYENTVIVAGFDDNNGQESVIAALDKHSGQILWKFYPDNSIKNNMVIAENQVIGTDVMGITYALDIETGQQLWRKNLNQSRLPAFVTGIVTDGNFVFSGFGHGLSALNINTGEILWQSQSWHGGEGTVANMVLAEDVLITSSHWRGLYAHDKQTGKLLWKNDQAGLRFRDTTPVYYQGFLWVAQQDYCFKLDIQTGKILEKFKTGMKHNGNAEPLFFQDNIILGSSHPGIAAFDNKSLAKNWTFDLQTPLFYTPPYYSDHQQSMESTPILINDQLFFGGMDGWLYLVKATSGQLIWQQNIGAPILSTPVLSESHVFLCDFGGNVHCWKIKE